jgi:hypothetical protein
MGGVEGKLLSRARRGLSYRDGSSHRVYQTVVRGKGRNELTCSAILATNALR